MSNVTKKYGASDAVTVAFNIIGNGLGTLDLISEGTYNTVAHGKRINDIWLTTARLELEEANKEAVAALKELEELEAQ